MSAGTDEDHGGGYGGRRGVRRSETGYDAFVSYAHSVDHRVAPALQQGLHAFARPADQPSALRVFLDGTSLAATPDLWGTIEAALGRSGYFVLLASPESARSPWVRREVEFWRRHRERDTFLIVLTGGRIRWDHERGDFDWPATDALPPLLRGWFAREPLWVDLSWARAEAGLTLENARFRDDVGTVAAAIHNVPKDRLDSEDLRRHLRRKRKRRGARVSLAVLSVLAVVGALFAWTQRNEATEEAQVARARQLAALAVQTIDSRLDLAQLYAVEAYRLHADAQTTSALFQTVTSSPHLVRVLPTGVRARVLAGSAQGRVVVAGTADGRLVRWDLERGTESQVRLGDAGIVEIATDLGGSKVVASDGSRVFLWHGEDGARPAELEVDRPDDRPGQGKYLTVSPSGDTVAAIGRAAGGRTELVVLDGSTGREQRRTEVPGHWLAIGLADDTTLNAVAGGPVGALTQLSLPSMEFAPGGRDLAVPADGFACCGFSVDASFTTWAKAGTARVIPANLADPYSGEDEYFPVAVPIGEPDRFAVSPDGTTVAVAGGGDLYAARFEGNTPVPPRHLLGTGDVDAVAFIGDGRQLVSASGTSLFLWDLAQASRVLAGPVEHATTAPEAGDQPLVAVSPDGKRVAVSGWGRENLVIAAPQGERAQPAKPVEAGLPVWSRDGTRLLLVAPGTEPHGAYVRSSGEFTPAWSEPNRNVPVAARVSEDGQRVAVVSDRGDVQVRSFADGTVLSDAPGEPEHTDDGRRTPAAISADLTHVATVRSDGNVWLTETETGAHRRLPGPPAASVAHADNALLVGRADHSLEVWDSAGQHLLRTIPADAGYTPVMTAIPNSPYVARLTAAGTVTLWHTGTGDLLGSITLPDSRTDINSTLVGSPDGRELVSATGNGVIARWRLGPADWIQVACASAGRDLTPSEWTSAVGGAPPDDIACAR